jgi:conjugal transfer pilus assembly protein TraU
MNLRPLRQATTLAALILCVVVSLPDAADAVCPSKPILETLFTDVCWSCVFPFRLGGVDILTLGMPDTPWSVNQVLCACDDSLLPGVTVSFWEPIRLIEVVREPYCFPSLAGLRLSPDTISHAGTYDESRQGGAHQAGFYQVHYVAFPIWQILGLTVAFVSGALHDITIGLFPDLSKCFSVGGFDAPDLALLYLTELDPLWNDDELGVLLNPEAVLFGNPVTQAVCAADCVAASAGFPLDPLFWCAGCWGSLYPFGGTVAGPVGEIDSASLLAARALAKFNREFLEGVTTGTQALCRKQFTGFIKKSQYRLQLIYPIPTTQKPGCCPPIGRSTMIWGSGKSFPIRGEDFVFLVFRKKECCAR